MFGLVRLVKMCYSPMPSAFRGSDRETRLPVVRVFLSEQKHRDNGKHKRCKGLLSKARVANHLEELLKRVKSVFESGDLESRALALVLFGCWADFVKDDAWICSLSCSIWEEPNLSNPSITTESSINIAHISIRRQKDAISFCIRGYTLFFHFTKQRFNFQQITMTSANKDHSVKSDCIHCHSRF